MKFTVRVKPSSKENSIEKNSDTEFSLRIKSPARDGKANSAVIDLLHEYFTVPRSRIKILHGQKGRIKTIEIV